MKKIIPVLLIVFITILLLFYFNSLSTKILSQNSIRNATVITKTKDVKKYLLKNKLEIKKNSLILLYNGFDCYKCIIKALKIIDKFPIERQQIIIIASASNLHTEFEQSNLDITNIITFDDTHDSLRRVLAYPKTPLLLKMNSERVITNAITVLSDDNITNEMYIDSLLAK